MWQSRGCGREKPLSRSERIPNLWGSCPRPEPATDILPVEGYRANIRGCRVRPLGILGCRRFAELIVTRENINTAPLHIVWIGLGAAKEEYWAASHLRKVTAPVLIGVGAGFDFHAGVKPQAPRWMMRAGLEWFFRMLSEPRRLGPRYLRDNPVFAWNILLQALGKTPPPLT